MKNRASLEEGKSEEVKSEESADAGRKWHRVYLGLGANQGDRRENIGRAIVLIGERVGTVVRQSSLIETEPWGFESENKFLNGVILVETTLSPREVLHVTQQIERDLGKTVAHATRRSNNARCTMHNAQCSMHNAQSTKFKDEPSGKAQTSNFKLQTSNYKDRPIDIDILLYDDLTVNEPDLKIPHPLMYQRDFVMIPLNEIADN